MKWLEVLGDDGVWLPLIPPHDDFGNAIGAEPLSAETDLSAFETPQ